MSRRGGDRRVLTLIASLAALLPAGGWAAVTVHREPATTVVAGGRAGATGLGSVDLLDEGGAPAPSTTVSVAPATVPASTPAPATTPTTRSPKSATTTKPPAGTGSTATRPPGVPGPNTPPPTGIPNIPPAASWETEANGVTARLRIEPAAPVAGQPVTFRMDFSSAEPCCTVMLEFGDGGGFSVNNGASCADLSPGPHSAVTTHTYAKAGSYKLTLGVIAAMPCMNLIGPGAPNPPQIHGAQLTGCVGIGPGPAAQKGCSPFPPFAPDQLVSPVIDPLCQVRSDCSKASTPRPGWDA